MIPSDQEEVPEPTKAAGKKGKKDRKKKKEAELEDAQKELESIAAGDDIDLVNEVGKYVFEIVLLFKLNTLLYNMCYRWKTKQKRQEI